MIKLNLLVQVSIDTYQLYENVYIDICRRKKTRNWNLWLRIMPGPRKRRNICQSSKRRSEKKREKRKKNLKKNKRENKMLQRFDEELVNIRNVIDVI